MRRMDKKKFEKKSSGMMTPKFLVGLMSVEYPGEMPIYLFETNQVLNPEGATKMGDPFL